MLFPTMNYLSRRRLNRSCLSLTKPAFTESRGELVLLIWPERAHWMVVDHEFHGLLNSFDGKREVRQILDEHDISARLANRILDNIKNLVDVGVLHKDGENRDSAAISKTELPGIENFAVNLTQRCNLKCAFCYNQKPAESGSETELTATEIISFLKNARKHAVKKPVLFLLGGEPTLVPDKLIEVATYATTAGFQVLVSTNGTNISPDFPRQARRLGMQVQVSLDGHTPEINDAVRGQGSFETAVKGIKQLVNAGVYTILSMVCHEGNLEHIADYYRFAQSLSVKEARVIPLKRIGGALQAGLVPVPVSTIIAKTVQMLEQHPQYLELMGRDTLSILGNSCRQGVRRKSCGIGLQTVLLDANGRLYPCLNSNCAELEIGNIRDESFDFGTMWKTSSRLDKIRQQTAVANEDNRCRKCIVRYWCLGGCRGETYAVKGTLNAPSPSCSDWRRSVIDMMWLLAEKPQWVKRSFSDC